MTKFAPKRLAKDLTQQEAEAIITNGFIDDIHALERLIPKKLKSSWIALPEDHIQYGVKYDWKNDSDSARWVIRLHAPDLKAPSSIANATVYWIVRVQYKGKYLQTGSPLEWKKKPQPNSSHIPIRINSSNLAVIHETIIEMAAGTRTTSKSILKDRLETLGT